MPSTSRGRKRTLSSASEILSKMEIDSDSLSSLSEIEIESEDKIEVPPFSDTDFVCQTADESFEACALNFDVEGSLQVSQLIFFLRKNQMSLNIF